MLNPRYKGIVEALLVPIFLSTCTRPVKNYFVVFFLAGLMQVDSIFVFINVSVFIQQIRGQQPFRGSKPYLMN